MADTDLIFTGLYYAVGYTVTACIGGLDCGDYVVDSTGSITVPINSDPDQLCNGTYLYTLDVGPWDRTTYGNLTTELTIGVPGVGEATIYIPVAIGFVYPSIGMRVRPTSEQQLKSPQGPGTGKKRRVAEYGILFGAVVGGTNAFQIGTALNKMQSIKAQTLGGVNLTHNIVFQGVAFGALPDSDSYDGQICWQMLRPYPCIIDSLNGFIETSEH